MMMEIREKSQLMQDLQQNWIIGDKECKKSQIGVNNLKAKISNL